MSLENDSVKFDDSLQKLITIMRSNGLQYAVHGISACKENYFPINIEIDGFCVGISDIGNSNFEDRNIIVVPLFEIEGTLDFSGCRIECDSTTDMSWYFNGDDILEHGREKFMLPTYGHMVHTGNINKVMIFYSNEKSLIKCKLRI